MLLYLLLFSKISLLLYAVWILYNKKFILKGIPEPPGNLFLGHILEARSINETIGVMTKYFNKYGRTVKVRIGPFYGLGTCDYKFIKFLLSSNTILTKSENYHFLRAWLGTGLLITDGDLWRRHRKIITPAFHFEILKQFVGVFETVGDELVRKLRDLEGTSLDLHPVISLCTLDIICETAMGTKIDAQNNKNSDYVYAVKEMLRIIIDRNVKPWKIIDSIFALSRDFYKQKKMLGILHRYSSNVIEKTMSKMANNVDYNANLLEKKKLAFLNLLLKYGEDEKISLNEIRDEVNTFMFEGHDTTASAICFTLYCLANHPEVQKQALEEQIGLFGDERNPVISHQDLLDMKYLELVIKEALRLYPSVPLLGRFTTEDIEYNGTIIPAKTNIVISVYNMHRNPEFFPDPEAFIPERFELFDGKKPFAYIPFSAGPRNCIGQKFAMLEMKSTVSKVLRNFELLPAIPHHDLHLVTETVLRSTNGVKIGIKCRS